MHRSAIAAAHGRIFNPSVLLSALGAPTKVQLVLQGQDKQEQSNGALPQNADHLSIAWKSVAGATSYNIYRSVDQGAYTLYTTVTPAAAASAYSSYVTNSGTYDYVDDVDCAFQDTAATNCVGSYGAQISNGQLRSPGVAGVYHAPDANGFYFMPNVGYTYKVTAVNAAGESALSADSFAAFIVGGKRIMNHPNGYFNGTINYQDTGCPVASPLGHTTNAKWTTSSTNSYVNPYAGGGAVDGNFSTKGFNFLVLNIYPAQAGSAFTMAPEIAGDTVLRTATSMSATPYGTLVANQWNTLKIPLADLMLDQIGGKNAVQHAFYKVTYDTHVANEAYWIEWYFSVN
jgi:hypothetical protein